MSFKEKIKRRAMSKRVMGKEFLKETEGITFYKPEITNTQKDRNQIDIIPFEVAQDWYPYLLQKNGYPSETQPGEREYVLEIPVHKNQGIDNVAVLCLRLSFGKRCAVCEQRKKMLDKYDYNHPSVKALSVSWRAEYNVIDQKDVNKEIQIWDASVWEVESALMKKATLGENEFVLFPDSEEGKRILFEGKGRAGQYKDSAEPSNFEFQDRKPLAELYGKDIIQRSHKLDAMLVIPTEEEVDRLVMSSGIDDEAEEHHQQEPSEGENWKKESSNKFGDEQEGQKKRCFGKLFDKTPQCESECPEDTYVECGRVANGG